MELEIQKLKAQLERKNAEIKHLRHTIIDKDAIILLQMELVDKYRNRFGVEVKKEGAVA